MFYRLSLLFREEKRGRKRDRERKKVEEHTFSKNIMCYYSSSRSGIPCRYKVWNVTVLLCPADCLCCSGRKREGKREIERETKRRRTRIFKNIMCHYSSSRLSMPCRLSMLFRSGVFLSSFCGSAFAAGLEIRLVMYVFHWMFKGWTSRASIVWQ